MKQLRLFHTLVVGGALIVAGCTGSADRQAEQPVGNAEDNSATPAPADQSGAALQQTFCEPENSSVCRDGSPVEGLECCWMTSC
ncbi:MAG: hypothetical protein H7A21_07745 [Spirochaetales bacterium]|nr:hypothetical protein [Leptospiraceae bacterium]MCP5481307.1 hypothetical protein [Spirochaetales bacterium]MCP5485743.1 hypothetical protein [Spirochaetales bacterium]